ncbi:MAG: outer membrane protein assembly factor BamE [Burkholderiales bacterium]
MFLRALATIAVLLLASCGTAGLPALDLKPYRMEIQQGNFVDQDAVLKLKPGMSKEQVRFILGTPLLTDIFHADRWDYVYRRQRVNSNVVEHRRISVYFDDGKLKRIEGDVVAEKNAGVTPPDAQAQPASAPASAASTPASGKAQNPAAAAQAASDSGKPAPAAAAGKAAAAPDTADDGPPQKKSWWQWLKDRF